VEAEYGLKVINIASLGDLIEFMREQGGLDEHLKAVEAYRAQYGV